MDATIPAVMAAAKQRLPGALATVDGHDRTVTFRCGGSLCRMRRAALCDAEGRPQLEVDWWPARPRRMLPDDQAHYDRERQLAAHWLGLL